MMQLNKIYNLQLEGSSQLLINDYVVEVRAKVTNLFADQYPDI
jgi:Flp pilus assembly secretin CpaC